MRASKLSHRLIGFLRNEKMAGLKVPAIFSILTSGCRCLFYASMCLPKKAATVWANLYSLSPGY